MGLMATGFKAVAGVALVVMVLMAVRVSAQAHHIVGDDNGWGPDLDVSSWLSGRLFSVGDRIWFKYSGTEDSIVELEGFEDFLSCNLTNPIKMYTDHVSHVILDKEGPRYFASRNPERCKNGLKLPVNVRPSPEYDPPFPDKPTPPHGPYPPFMPTPPHEPPVHDWPPPPPPYEPPVHNRPPPPPPYEPPVHNRPPPPPPYEPPVHNRPPPPPPYEPPVHNRPPPPPPHEPPVHNRPPPPPPYEPPVHNRPPPPPPYDRPPPPPPYEPPVHNRPPPPPPYEPPVPVRPPPPPPYVPPTPSAAARVSVLSLVLAGGMLMCGA